VADISFDDLRRQNAFAVLAELYPDEVTCRHLLEDVGARPSQLRPFGYLTAVDYWRDVCQMIWHGRFATVNLTTLVAEAIKRYPGNGLLKSLSSAPEHPAADTSELRVLCLSANPLDTNRIRVDAEHRAILAATRGSRRPVLPILHPATRNTDVVARLLDARPHIVHFGGYGSRAGELLFEDERGDSAPVEITALAKVLGTLPRLECVVLSSCYSGGYATALLDACAAVVGSPLPLQDACALGFTEHFYRALGDGRAPRDAYSLAVAALGVIRCPPHDIRLEEP
jgi:hypothetical protein